MHIIRTRINAYNSPPSNPHDQLAILECSELQHFTLKKNRSKYRASNTGYQTNITNIFQIDIEEHMLPINFFCCVRQRHFDSCTKYFSW